MKPGSKYLNLNPYEVSSNCNESMDIVVETNQAEGIEKICMLSLCLVSITVSALAPPWQFGIFVIFFVSTDFIFKT